MNLRIHLFVTVAALLVTLLPMPLVPPCAGGSPPPHIGGSLFAAAVLSDTGAVMVGDRGKIYLSRDGAKSWKAVDSGTKAALSSVCFPDDHHGWVAGQAGVLLHSRDGGETWAPQSSGVHAYLLDVDFLDARHGIAVGRDTTVLTTADGGSTWRRSPLRESAALFEDLNLFAAAVMDEGRACVVGGMGRIFITPDGGQTWSESKTTLYDEPMMMGRTLYALAYDAGILYGSGIDSTFVTSKDQGKTWTEGNTGFSKPDLFCIDVVGTLGLAAGSGGHVIRTSDGGATWQVVEVPESVTRFWLSGVDLRQSGPGSVTGLLVGERGSLGRVAGNSIEWQGSSTETERTGR